jgi:hypothetical protein
VHTALSGRLSFPWKLLIRRVYARIHAAFTRRLSELGFHYDRTEVAIIS